MGRKKICRRVEGCPHTNYFKPVAIPLRLLEENELSLDEFEAIRLADFEKLYQENAAEKMGVSRQTFGRIIESARRKIADALINGKALKINNNQTEETL